MPEADALQQLLDLYAGFAPELREKTAFLACLPLAQDGTPRHGGRFTAHGLVPVTPMPDESYYCCHTTIWSGCLYRLAAVRQIGLPNVDYVLDRGEDGLSAQPGLAGNGPDAGVRPVGAEVGVEADCEIDLDRRPTQGLERLGP